MFLTYFPKIIIIKTISRLYMHCTNAITSLSKGVKMKNILYKNRLTFLMLITVFVGGSYLPILSMYLKDFLQFSGKQTGLVMSMSIVAAFVSPLVSIFLVDRLMKRVHFVALCQLLTAFFLFLLSFQRDFLPFITVFTLTMVVSAPIMGLMQAIIFDNLNDKEDKGGFGRVRLWGALGWIAASWFFGLFWIGYFGVERLSDTFRFAAAVSLIVTVYLLFLKDNNRGAISKKENTFKIENIKSTFNRQMLLMIIFFLIACFLNSFYFFGAAPFLKQLNIKESYIMPLMTIANIVEIITLSRLTFIQKRLSFKQIFIIGILVQIVALIIFALFKSPVVIIVGLALQGLTFALVIPVLIIFADSLFDKKARTTMHQILILVVQIASFLANNIGGIIMDNVKTNSGINYFYFWLFAIFISAGGLVIVYRIFARSKVSCKKLPDLQVDANKGC